MEWEDLFFCCEYNENMKCLICSKTIHGILRSNIQRHYFTCHAEYAELKGIINIIIMIIIIIINNTEL